MKRFFKRTGNFLVQNTFLPNFGIANAKQFCLPRTQPYCRPCAVQVRSLFTNAVAKETGSELCKQTQIFHCQHKFLCVSVSTTVDKPQTCLDVGVRGLLRGAVQPDQPFVYCRCCCHRPHLGVLEKRWPFSAVFPSSFLQKNTFPERGKKSPHVGDILEQMNRTHCSSYRLAPPPLLPESGPFADKRP